MIDDCLQIDLTSLLTKINKSVKVNGKKNRQITMVCLYSHFDLTIFKVNKVEKFQSKRAIEVKL